MSKHACSCMIRGNICQLLGNLSICLFVCIVSKLQSRASTVRGFRRDFHRGFTVISPWFLSVCVYRGFRKTVKHFSTVVQ